MSDTALKTFIDTTVPESRRGLFHYADNTLTRVGIMDHALSVDNLLSTMDDEDTVTIVAWVEKALTDRLIMAIQEYGVGVEKPDLAVLPTILTGMHDLLDYSDKDRLLDLCDEYDDPKETLSAILAEIYQADIVVYMETLDYVTPALISKIVTNLQQLADMDAASEADEYDDEAADVEEDPVQNADAIRRFLDRHPNPAFDVLTDHGFRLGYRVEVYLDALFNGRQSHAEVALHYMTAALASGDTIPQAIQAASARLDGRIDDKVALQQILQHVGTYRLEE